MRRKHHDVAVLTTAGEFLMLSVDGQKYRIPWQECSQRLAQASTDERKYIKISPSGYEIHWPLIDEDLAIEPLLHHTEIFGER